MSDADSVRKQVSETYTKAATRPVSSEGCCCSPAEPKGVSAKIAGYSPEELASLPSDAVHNSFGCGNPLAYSGVQEGQTVLDLGSGAGIDLLLAAKKVGPGGKVIGVDMTDEMIDRARRNIKDAGVENVEVRKGIIEDLPVEAGTVDWVISNCVINLSPEKEKVFKEIHRVLKPGGRFSISDIMVQDLPEWMRSDQRLYSACVSGAIAEEDYLAGLRSSGHVDVEVTERLHYDRSQMIAFLDSEELPAVGNIGREQLEELAKSFEGKIWSARVAGKKA